MHQFLGRCSVVLALFAAPLGCAGGSEPRVERWVDGVWQPVASASYRITGKRDGAATFAVATFALEADQRLQVELTIVYNPTPALGAGRWRLDGAQPAGGEVVAESIKFLGGQGEGPSLGGRFRLEENGRARYRVILPARPLSS
ncbi:MAG TPA: hypothetical protein VFT13_11770 [Candidatus Krumholzibacteria bacterium]|nr:hypothetical protein [Candidatus Krumholzibacteria bacterium]